MNSPKKPTVGKIFSQISSALNFKGKGKNRFIEYSTHYLIINCQKSSYGKSFYINVAIFYKEMLNFPLTEEDIEDAYKIHAPVLRHVDFRIEDCPTVSRELQRDIDQLVKDGRMNELRELLQDALKKMLTFMEENHDRKTIRRLNQEKKFPAMLLKEV